MLHGKHFHLTTHTRERILTSTSSNAPHVEGDTHKPVCVCLGRKAQKNKEKRDSVQPHFVRKIVLFVGGEGKPILL